MIRAELDKSLLKRLEPMQIVSRGVFGGNPTGERRGLYRGVGIEFADHRGYTPGDDFRYIDWNVLARTNEVFIKLFDRQEAVPLYMLVDGSASMRIEDGLHGSAPRKIDCAAQIATCLAHVGLCNGDMVRAAVFGDTILSQGLTHTHRRETRRVAEFLADAPEGGLTNFAKALPHFAKRTARRGIVFVLSDFLDSNEGGVTEGIQSLLYRKFHVCAIHLVSQADAGATETGEFSLVDSETGDAADVRIRRGALERYRQLFEEHRRGIEKFLRVHGCDYVMVRVEDDLADVLTKQFRRAGILQ